MNPRATIAESHFVVSIMRRGDGLQELSYLLLFARLLCPSIVVKESIAYISGFFMSSTNT